MQIRIQGGMYHLLGPLHPNHSAPRQFAQLYVIDNGEEQLRQRVHAMQGRGAESALNNATLSELQRMLHECNRFVQMFRQCIDMDEEGIQQWELVLREKGNATIRLPGHARRYNVPSGAGLAEVAGFMHGAEAEDDGPACGRDIVMHYRVRHFLTSPTRPTCHAPLRHHHKSTDVPFWLHAFRQTMEQASSAYLI